MKNQFRPTSTTSLPIKRETAESRWKKAIGMKLTILSLFVIVAFLVGSNLHMRKALNVEQLSNKDTRLEIEKLTTEVVRLKETIEAKDTEIAQVIKEHAEAYSKLQAEFKELTVRVNREPYNLKDITQPSNATVSKLDNFLSHSKLKGYGQAYMDAERAHGVNAYMIASLHIWESGWGTSAIFKEKNNGFGWRAYNESLQSAKSFSSVEESIDYVAHKIKVLYLTENGKFHRGYGLRDINVKYAQNRDGSPNYAWSKGISTLMYKMAYN
jgi:beta-N-acetylglucosaminidase